MTEQSPTTQQNGPVQQPRRRLSPEVQSAENQIATVDEQLAEMQGEIDDAEIQIEVMSDEIRKRERTIKAKRRKMQKLIERRALFIEVSANLRKLELP